MSLISLFSILSMPQVAIGMLEVGSYVHYRHFDAEARRDCDTRLCLHGPSEAPGRIGLSRASRNPYLLDAVMCSEGDSDGELGQDGSMLQYAVDTR